MIMKILNAREQEMQKKYLIYQLIKVIINQ